MTKKHSNQIYIWLVTGVVLITCIVIIGGITRLTRSGLSIVEWKPISGILPPLSEREWIETFEKYQESPEFIHYNNHFTLEDYKMIYFWEYLHRLFGRVIGIAFIIPFVIFLLKKAFSPLIKKRVFVILLLGAAQGIMGWVMVKSGLSDQPHVSHYRLMMHLILAVFLIAYIYYTALLVKNEDYKYTFQVKDRWRKWVVFVFILLLAQLIYGALVAGLKAGYIYNTFPKMGNSWLPVNFANQLSENGLLAFFEDPGIVQFMHRILGFILMFTLGLYWFKFRHKKLLSFHLLSGTVVIQVLLGVLTLLLVVPIWLGVLHQFVAILLVLFLTHHYFLSGRH